MRASHAPRFTDEAHLDPDEAPDGVLSGPLFTLALLSVLLAVSPALAQIPRTDGLAPADAIGAVYADTSSVAAEASLRLEHVRLDLARHELRAVSGWRRLRPQLDLFLSVSTRGLAFPSISSQGYDPAYAAISRWPGDTWGVTLSWTVDQVLDRRPVHRARAAVALAEARIALTHARREQHEAARRERLLARAERDALTRRRADLAAAQLRIEAAFLTRRLDAQRELLRLAQMTYDQGESDFSALARQRLATLSAEHALATNTARLATLDAGGDVATAFVTAPLTLDHQTDR